MKYLTKKRWSKTISIKRLFMLFFLMWFQAFAFMGALVSLAGRKLG